jgi:hypothetical protein
MSYYNDACYQKVARYVFACNYTASQGIAVSGDAEAKKERIEKW